MRKTVPLVVLALAASLCACLGERPSVPKEYSDLVDKVYVTKKVLLVYSHGGFDGSLAVPGEGGAPGLSEIQPTFPQRSGSDTIFGLLPVGSRIKVASARMQWSTVSGWETVFGFKVLEPHKFASLSIWEAGLMDYDRSPLRPKPELFEEEPKPAGTTPAK